MMQAVQTPRRLHPIWMGAIAFEECKEMLGFIVLFAIGHKTREISMMLKYILLAGILGYMVYKGIRIFLRWYNFLYQIQDDQLVIQDGKFVKKEKFVPLSQIQYVHNETPIIYQPFGITKLVIQMGSTHHETEVVLHAITKKESERLQQICSKQVETKTTMMDDAFSEVYRIRFQDIVKASLTSFSFLIVTFFLLRIWDKLNEFVSLSAFRQNVVQTLGHSYVAIAIGILFFFILTLVLGIGYTYLRFGQYTVRIDETRLYIRKGITTETEFIVEKDKIQGITFSSSVIRRFFGLVEVKLICAGKGNEKLGINTLFPFVQKKEAVELVQRIFPQFVKNESLQRLSKQALFIKVFRALVVTLVVGTAQLYWFTEEWYITVAVLVICLLLQITSYKQSGYDQEGDYIESQSGLFTLHRAAANRKNIEKLQVKQTWLQRRFGLCHIVVFPTTSIAHAFKLHDVPEQAGAAAYEWYKTRNQK